MLGLPGGYRRRHAFARIRRRVAAILAHSTPNGGMDAHHLWALRAWAAMGPSPRSPSSPRLSRGAPKPATYGRFKTGQWLGFRIPHSLLVSKSYRPLLSVDAFGSQDSEELTMSCLPADDKQPAGGQGSAGVRPERQSGCHTAEGRAESLRPIRFQSPQTAGGIHALNSGVWGGAPGRRLPSGIADKLAPVSHAPSEAFCGGETASPSAAGRPSDSFLPAPLGLAAACSFASFLPSFLALRRR